MKKQFFSRFHFDLKQKRLNLSSAWILGITSAFIGTVAVALCAVILFLGAFDADTVTSDMTSDVETISREDLADSVRIIDERMGDFERLKSAPPILPDPSR